MQPYQTSKVSQTDKATPRIILTQKLWLIRANFGLHTDVQPEQPPKKEQYAFPTPTNTKSDPRASICSAGRLLKLYNKQHGKNQKILTNVVKAWFKGAAHQAGWSKVAFLEDVQTSRITGCMLCATRQKGALHAQTH